MTLPKSFDIKVYSVWYEKNFDQIMDLVENPVEGLDDQYINQLVIALGLLSSVEMLGEESIDEQTISILNEASSGLDLIIDFFTDLAVIPEIKKILFEMGFKK
jgi:hypothetical protein